MSVKLLLFISLCLTLSGVHSLSNKPILIVISYDGFRWDYLDKTETPNFHSLIESGSTVPYMKSVFMTKTFVNHHSIATGLYPETHGLVDNVVWDEVYNKTLGVDDQDFYSFHDEVIPIWLRNEWEGDGRKSGAIMWPGGVHSYGSNSSRISRTMPYNKDVPYTWRIDKGIEWLTDEIDPINFLMLYFEEPDSTGHDFGPESDNVKQMIKQQDDLTGYLIKRLKHEGLFDRVNIILLSDHGMQEVVLKRKIDIPQNIQALFERRTGGSPVWNIMPKEGMEDELYERLVNISHEKYFTVYKKEDIPEEWHIRNNRRILPLIMVAEPGWVFSDSWVSENQTVIGVHGYTNKSPNMWSFFIAHGPAFKKGFEGTPIDNIDVYPLMSHLLGIPQTPCNGSLSKSNDLLLVSAYGDGTGGAGQSHISTFGIFVPIILLYVLRDFF